MKLYFAPLFLKVDFLKVDIYKWSNIIKPDIPKERTRIIKRVLSVPHR
jgi:hypothetical protein